MARATTQISYVIPTRDRPERLKQTLHAIEALGPHAAEVIVIDNDSEEAPILPRGLASGVPVRALGEVENIGAAARNDGAAASDPASDWLVMLDDDSYPVNLDFVESLSAQAAGVGAVMADIFLAPQSGALPALREAEGGGEARPAGLSRESGGLPEVFIGCGVAIRRGLYLELGGYDRSFNYYAEEYDLAARVLLAGYRVAFDRRFVVHHAKDRTNRDMNVILERLVRNNGWVAQRYAPADRRVHELREVRRRYRQIASHEEALRGYGRGLVELRRTLRSQPRRAMTRGIWDRFTGLAAARAALQAAFDAGPFRSASIVESGKNAWVVAKALQELGVRLAGECDDAEVSVIGTMSPGPMLDGYRRRQAWRRGRGARLIAPWLEVRTGSTLAVAA